MPRSCDTTPTPAPATAPARRVCVDPQGPVLIEGPVEFVMEDGTIARSDRFMPAVCTCRRSRTPPWGEDLQLALYLLYELHYRGFPGVDDTREWDCDLLRLRQAMESSFLNALRTEVSGAPRTVEEAFAPLLAEPVDLSASLSRYLENAPAPLLATVNLMSLFGLHRALRGALVGHFACLEVTSSPGSRRLAHAMRRRGAGSAAEHFYAEHVEADAVHEQVVRHEVVGGLLADEPALEPEIAFGCAATVLLEDRLTRHVRGAWSQGHSALRQHERRGRDSGLAKPE